MTSVAILFLGLALTAHADSDTVSARAYTIRIQEGRIWLNGRELKPDPDGVIAFRLDSGERVLILPKTEWRYGLLGWLWFYRPERRIWIPRFRLERDDSIFLRLPEIRFRLERFNDPRRDPEAELEALERQVRELEARLRALRERLLQHPDL